MTDRCIQHRFSTPPDLPLSGEADGVADHRASDGEWRPSFYEAPHRWLLLGAVVVILLATFTMAGVVAWLASPGKEAASVTASNIPVTANGETMDSAREHNTESVRVKCVECTLVVSTREILQIMESMDSDAASEVKRTRLKVTALNLVNNYEVSVRMNDGASHQSMVANPANGRPGEQVILIEGKNRLRE